MLGRSHMGIGAVGAVVATPFLLHESWEPMRRLLSHSGRTIPHMLILQAILVAAFVIGSLLPDLDEPNALASRDLERFMALPVYALLVGIVFLLHRETSLDAWGMVIVLTLAFRTSRNLSRRLGLGLIAVLLAYLAWKHHLSWQATIPIALWCVGAMFSKHRTFTHSLIAVFMLGYGFWHVHTIFSDVHVAVLGLMIGYILHLIADAIAGGVPLFWPWSKRLGIRILTTGSAWDHMIGGLTVFGFLALALF
ncbi:hydrolase [Alicyclobacillus sp. TC]|nr:metal-dependent hydrolase [Alicyclobacillus sp. TC]QRF24210.1 hydrolase [Alicyclobacillus sp. TC]